MQSGRFTAFPNVLLDRVMPHLSDTEFRVLAVVVRETLGWQRASKWLTNGLLRQRTGRASAAVSRAIDHLVKRGLLVVREQDGHRLHRADERRRSHSKLSFSIHQLILESERYRQSVGFGIIQKRSSQCENNQTRSIQEKQTVSGKA